MQRICCGSTFLLRGFLLRLPKSTKRKPRSLTAEWGGSDRTFCSSLTYLFSLGIISTRTFTPNTGVRMYMSFLCMCLFYCFCIFGCGCFIMTWLQWQNQYAQTVGPCSSICSFCFGAAAGLTTQHRATLYGSNCPEAMRSNQGEADFFRAFDVSRLFTTKLRTNGLLYRNV